VRYRRESQSVPDTVHLFEVKDNRTVVFLSVFFEENDGQELVLGIISPRIFTGIQGKMG
jgi:hypothetical protein